jgi:hypothetical protein
MESPCTYERSDGSNVVRLEAYRNTPETRPNVDQVPIVDQEDVNRTQNNMIATSNLEESYYLTILCTLTSISQLLPPNHILKVLHLRPSTPFKKGNYLLYL